MPTVPALIDQHGAAVDARPLLALGIIDIGDPAQAIDRAMVDPGSLFDSLADEHTYALLVRRAATTTDELARAIACDLAEDFEIVRAAVDDATRRWHLALWRLADESIELADADIGHTVLAPVTPRPAGR